MVSKNRAVSVRSSWNWLKATICRNGLPAARQDARRRHREGAQKIPVGLADRLGERERVARHRGPRGIKLLRDEYALRDAQQIAGRGVHRVLLRRHDPLRFASIERG